MRRIGADAPIPNPLTPKMLPMNIAVQGTQEKPRKLICSRGFFKLSLFSYEIRVFNVYINS